MIACDLTAIALDRLGRYRELRRRLEAAARERRETPEGYTWRLDETEVTPAEAAEWMSLERLCCPFLDLSLDLKRGQSWLRPGGPEGVKALLEAVFTRGARSAR